MKAIFILTFRTRGDSGMGIVKEESVFDRDKAKEVIQYILYLTGKAPANFGKTKLHKILWFYEGLMTLAKGRRSIGGRFVKNRFGPTLKELDEIIEELEKNGVLKTKKAVKRGFSEWIFRVSPPELKHLTKEEIELISFLVYKFGNLRAKDLSRYTHTPAFEMKKEYEELNPLMILHYFVRKPTDKEVEGMRKFIELTEKGEYEKIVDEIKTELNLK